MLKPLTLGIQNSNKKGNRDEVEGKNFVGVFDKFIGDGGMDRIYQPLWWRAYRYIEIQIVTKDDPLTINELYGIRSVYPFEQKARFSISNTTNDFDTTTINKILEVGHRTMMACAHEHFMDCPYYEESHLKEIPEWKRWSAITTMEIRH
jgi:alpha-L-rhamnosidase